MMAASSSISQKNAVKLDVLVEQLKYVDEKINKLDTGMGSRLDRIDADLRTTASSIQTQLNGNYITKAEFNPVRNLVYGASTAMLLAVLGAIIALVVRQGP